MSVTRTPFNSGDIAPSGSNCDYTITAAAGDLLVFGVITQVGGSVAAPDSVTEPDLGNTVVTGANSTDGTYGPLTGCHIVVSTGGTLRIRATKTGVANACIWGIQLSGATFTVGTWADQNATTTGVGVTYSDQYAPSQGFTGNRRVVGLFSSIGFANIAHAVNDPTVDVGWNSCFGSFGSCALIDKSCVPADSPVVPHLNWASFSYGWGASVQITESAGGSTFYQAVGGSIAASGALSRKTSTTKGGSVAASGALARQTRLTKSGSVSASGALVRQTQKTLGGSVQATGALVRQVGKLLVAALAASGALTKRAAITKGGSLAASGALTRQTQKQLTGSVGASGVVVRQTQKVLAGSVAGVGALVRKTGKVLAGSIAASATLTQLRVFLRTLTGSIAASGSLTRQTGKVVGGQVAASGILTRLVARTLGGTVAVSGAVVRLVAKTLAGSIAASGALARTRVFLLTLLGSIAASGTLTRRTNKALGGQVGAAGVLTRSTAKTLGGTVGASGALTRLVRKTVGGTLGAIGALLRQLIVGGVQPPPVPVVVELTEWAQTAVDVAEYAPVQVIVEERQAT